MDRLQATEGDHLTVTVRLEECPSREPSGDAHVRVTARGQTAVEGEDFFAYRDLHFGAVSTDDGEVRTFRLEKVPLLVSDDQDREGEETFALVLELVGEPTLDCGRGPEPIEIGAPMLVTIADRMPPEPAEASLRIARAETEQGESSPAGGRARTRGRVKRKRAARRAARELGSPKVDPRRERDAARGEPVRVASRSSASEQERRTGKRKPGRRAVRLGPSPKTAKTAKAEKTKARQPKVAQREETKVASATVPRTREARRAEQERERLRKHERDLAARALRRRNAATKRRLAAERRANRRAESTVRIASLPERPAAVPRVEHSTSASAAEAPVASADVAPPLETTPAVTSPPKARQPVERGTSRSRIEAQLADLRSSLATLVEDSGRVPARPPRPERSATDLRTGSLRTSDRESCRQGPDCPADGRPAEPSTAARPAPPAVTAARAGVPPDDPCRRGSPSGALEVGFHEPRVRSVEGGLDVRTQVSNPYDVPVLVRVRVTLSKQLRPVGHGVNGARVAPHEREEVRFLYPAVDDPSLYKVSFTADVQPVCGSAGSVEAVSE